MSSAFNQGFEFFVRNSNDYTAAYMSKEYINRIRSEIEKTVKVLNENFVGNNAKTSILSGDVAEYMHAGSFNINAKVKGSRNEAYVDRSHDLGSADVRLKSGEKYSLKYYDTAQKSGKAQSITLGQRYKEYQGKGGTLSFEEYCNKNGFDPNNKNVSIYDGQIRLIPKNQVEDAIKALDRKIAKETAIGGERAESVNALKEAKELLVDKIKDNKGVESLSVSKEDMKKITELAQKGKISEEDLAQYGISLTNLLSPLDIAKQAAKAGLSAAVISAVLRIAPEIFKSIDYLLNNGEVSKDQLKALGFTAVSGMPEDFIKGALTAAITTSIKAEYLGEVLSSADSTSIATVVVIAFDTIKYSFEYSAGRITKYEFADLLAREVFNAGFSVMLGTISQSLIQIPVLGYMIGSFIGSLIGSFTYNYANKALLSLCVDTGFTLFGLVEQDYQLPEELLRSAGIGLFDYEKTEYDKFDPYRIDYYPFEYDKADYSTIDIQFIKRGLINVSKVAYQY